jgi:lipocalin-like protein
MRKALIALAAVALLGCGGDSTGPAASAVGTWNLQTVNNATLPYTLAFIANPLYKLELVSDAFVVRADGSYTETFTERETDGTTVTTTSDDDTGTWVQNNGALTITSSSDQSSVNAAISGNTITVNAQGLVLVFKRQ